MPRWVDTHHRIIPTIGIQIDRRQIFRIEVAYVICIEESAGLGVVVSGLEVVQRGFRVVVITAVAERVDMRNMLGVGEFNAAGVAVGVGNITAVFVGDLQDLTPRVVGIFCHGGERTIHNGDDVALQILAEVIPGAVVNDATHLAHAVIHRHQAVATPRLLQDDGALQEVSVGYTVHRFAGADVAQKRCQRYVSTFSISNSSKFVNRENPGSYTYDPEWENFLQLTS